ncbi:restriction endonuclease subunit S [uncultured Streptococcus sp.]|nr:restriction endonuclease subunit S [uncultured Streptococcus sp.]
MKTNGVPKIRFKGFTDDWEQRKLGEVADKTYGGGTPKTSIEEYWQGNIPWIQSQDLSENKVFGVEPRKYINQKAIENSATKIIPKNSIAIITRVGVGKLALMPISYCTSQDFLSLSSLKINELYATYVIYKMLQIEKEKVQGTSIKGITSAELLSKKIDVPIKYAEQQKVGEYFSNLDCLITLHQRKCEQIKELKKFMLQKMFPKKGEKNPEIRFPGFTDGWEQRKFGELYEKVSRKNDMTYGTEQIISVANMYYKVDANVKRQDYLKTYNIFELGDIAFEGNKSKHFAHGRFVENTIGNGIVSHVFDVFKPIMDFNLSFWKYYINYEGVMGPILTRVTKASTMMTNLVSKDFLNEDILVPSIAEQQKIGEYLSNLDYLITLHQRKCEQLKELKKFMLQNMFPKKG